MVKQFEQEGRGPGWVKDGKLVQRTAPETYGPNYPSPPPPPTPSGNQTCWGGKLTSGMGVALLPHQSGNPTICQDFAAVGGTLELVSRPDLCLTQTAPSTFVVATCTAHNSGQQFKIGARGSHPQKLANAAGDCVVAATETSTLTTKPCTAADTVWVFGASGRICLGGGECISVLPKMRIMESAALKV